MPQITHRDLVAFADERVNLKKSEVDDQRAQVNRLRDRIEAKIAATPGHGLVKSLHAGSVAKGTALRNVNDRDLAVYVRAEQAPADTPSLVRSMTMPRRLNSSSPSSSTAAPTTRLPSRIFAQHLNCRPEEAGRSRSLIQSILTTTWPSGTRRGTETCSSPHACPAPCWPRDH